MSKITEQRFGVVTHSIMNRNRARPSQKGMLKNNLPQRKDIFRAEDDFPQQVIARIRERAPS